jgi:general secretion pathway protein D
MQDGQGTVEIDKKSNRVFVRDVEERVKKVENIIRAFDVRQPQVLIVAKLVEVTLNDDFRFGINWKLVVDKLGSFNTLSTAATYAVAPPVGAALTTLSLGSGTDDLQVVIQMIETMGKTNTLSAPRITVLNNEEAKLAVATKQPFVSQTVVQSTTSSTTADNVQFVDVGVTLKVTPMISSDNYIQMKIRPEVSTAGTPLELQGVSAGSETAFTRTIVPVITTQELETTVTVKSGTTLVIGGLIQDKQEKTNVKLPIVGNIPIIGRAFSSKTHNFSKSELVIFITPTILNPEESTLETQRFFDGEGKLLPHDEAGGYIYDKAYFHSQGPARTDDKPYWEVSGLKVPEYFPDNLYDRKLDPYKKQKKS